MTTAKLQTLAAEAISLDRQINQLTARLDQIKQQLIAEAQTRPEEHTPTASGGWSWQALTPAGDIVRITQDGPKLKSSISTDKDISKCRLMTGEAFDTLFELRHTYKLCHAFRERAADLLGIRPAARLIKTLSSAGPIKVSYETKEAA